MVATVRGNTANNIGCNGFMSGVASAVEGTHFLNSFFLASNGVEKETTKKI
jgi:hypothetical protein